MVGLVDNAQHLVSGIGIGVEITDNKTGQVYSCVFGLQCRVNNDGVVTVIQLGVGDYCLSNAYTGIRRYSLLAGVKFTIANSRPTVVQAKVSTSASRKSKRC